ERRGALHEFPGESEGFGEIGRTISTVTSFLVQNRQCFIFTTKYRTRPLTALNQCGPPASIVTTSPAASVCSLPPSRPVPRDSFGAVSCPPTRLPPVTNVAAPSTM